MKITCISSTYPAPYVEFASPERSLDEWKFWIDNEYECIKIITTTEVWDSGQWPWQFHHAFIVFDGISRNYSAVFRNRVFHVSITLTVVAGLRTSVDDSWCGLFPRLLGGQTGNFPFVSFTFSLLQGLNKDTSWRWFFFWDYYVMSLHWLGQAMNHCIL